MLVDLFNISIVPSILSLIHSANIDNENETLGEQNSAVIIGDPTSNLQAAIDESTGIEHII